MLVQRNRSAYWLKNMVQWMKGHKKFWAQRLHTGDRAVEQLAKHMQSGACCEQFDSHLVVTHGSDILMASKHNAYLLPNYAKLAAEAAAAIPVAKYAQEADQGYGFAYHTVADMVRGVPTACHPRCGCTFDADEVCPKCCNKVYECNCSDLRSMVTNMGADVAVGKGFAVEEV